MREILLYLHLIIERDEEFRYFNQKTHLAVGHSNIKWWAQLLVTEVSKAYSLKPLVMLLTGDWLNE